jgi:CheY-like chemotaxis protein
MMGQTHIPPKIQLPNELTPLDDAKKIISEVLKRVDQLIRKGELDRAQGEISKAKELDPRNVYALALEERVSSLKTDFIHTENERVNNLAVIEDVSKTAKNIPVIPYVPESISTTTVSTQSKDTANRHSAHTSSLIAATIKSQELQQQDHILDRSVEIESYRKTMVEALIDGALSDNEDRQLSELRTLLEITDAEHERIEKNVKYECYRNALLRQLSESPAILSSSKALANLQKKYNISVEDHEHVKALLMNTMQFKHRDKVLVIDDDSRLLELLASSLEENGFDVTALPTSDEAFALLRKFVPDLILCDINLETSTMGGFTFYEKVQELKNAQQVPFIFLTGLTDEALVRTGKELGVDDYLMKPISEQTLVSTLRGKLKRFKQLKKIAATQIPVMVAA